MSKEPEAAKQVVKKKCGLIMPISEIDGCDEQHWLDVKRIFTEVCNSLDLEASLVSDSDDSVVIQKSIVQNIYLSDVVICDVSCFNPNVMFELGLRIAVDKPLIIVKDNLTNFSFDISPIKHLQYPRDLNWSKILQFQEDLKLRLTASLKPQEKRNSENNSYLSVFGDFKVPKPQVEEVGKDEYLLSRVENLIHRMERIESGASGTNVTNQAGWVVNYGKRVGEKASINEIELKNYIEEILDDLGLGTGVIPPGKDLDSIIDGVAKTVFRNPKYYGTVPESYLKSLIYGQLYSNAKGR